MPRPHLVLDHQTAPVAPEVVEALRARFDAVRSELGVPERFPDDVLAEATAAAAAPLPELPDGTATSFFTIDPPGSLDLDQAMHLEREGVDGTGYRVRYAIADVPAFVAPGGPLDRDTRERGTTIYAPDRRTPLHPPILSEGAASLLPGAVRPAYVWDLHLAADGSCTAASVRRELVRSVERLDYAAVQAALDAGSADERFVLLREIGERRQALERARGGASLPLPEQEAEVGSDGVVHLTFRPPRPVEDWNAQISLLAGIAAADLMIGARVGLLRTMPPAPDQALARFRRQARALGVDWPAEQSYGDLVRSLDLTDPRQLALVHAAASLFRGAGYTPLDGTLPEQREHAAVAAPYAHVTAPLRRLVDRFGLAVCEAICAGVPVPDWAHSALSGLPGEMAAGDHRARAVEKACADAVEAAVLSTRVGERFRAVVVETTGRGVQVQLLDEPVLALARGTAALGASVEVVLEAADIAAGTVTFALTHDAAGGASAGESHGGGRAGL